MKNFLHSVILLVSLAGSITASMADALNQEKKIASESPQEQQIVFERECEKGVQDFCFLAGKNLEEHPELAAQATNKPRHFYRRACPGNPTPSQLKDQTLAAACFRLAMFDLEDESKASQEKDEAFQLIGSVCEGYKVAKACRMQSLILWHALYAQPKDEKAALTIVERLCAQGDAKSCSHVGYFLLKDGPLQDQARAILVLKNTCETKGDVGGACTELGLAYYHGRGVEQDGYRAGSYFELGCEAGNQVACNNAVRVLTASAIFNFEYKYYQDAWSAAEKACHHAKAKDLEALFTACEYYYWLAAVFGEEAQVRNDWPAPSSNVPRQPNTPGLPSPGVSVPRMPNTPLPRPCCSVPSMPNTRGLPGPGWRR